MSIFVAIIGLAVLVLIHEAGHFFAARAVGMTPRKFYLGFGQPIVKRVRKDVEYGIGVFPLGGYVKIPGMSRPEPGLLGSALREDVAREHAAGIARVDDALTRGDERGARVALEELRPEIGSTRGWQELEMSLAPDAYWRQATWRRLVVIAAGPAVNLLFAVILFTGVFMVATDTDRTTNIVGGVEIGSPAAASGFKTGDKILDVAGKPVDPNTMADQIRATHGKPFVAVVQRGTQRIPIHTHARLDQGEYRIGILIEGKLGPGASLPRAATDAVKETWFEVRDTVVGIGHLARGQDTRGVSSSVGIVRAESAAWRQGLRSFFAILGSVSLALGLLNLIPILPLDGGHIVIALVEKLRGRTFGQGVYLRYSLVGLSLFAILMYIGLRNDLHGIFGG